MWQTALLYKAKAKRTSFSVKSCQRLSSMRPHSLPSGVKRLSALSDRSSSRYSEREVSILYGSLNSCSKSTVSRKICCLCNHFPKCGSVQEQAGIAEVSTTNVLILDRHEVKWMPRQVPW